MLYLGCLMTCGGETGCLIRLMILDDSWWRLMMLDDGWCLMTLDDAWWRFYYNTFIMTILLWCFENALQMDVRTDNANPRVTLRLKSNENIIWFRWDSSMTVNSSVKSELLRSFLIFLICVWMVETLTRILWGNYLRTLVTNFTNWN